MVSAARRGRACSVRGIWVLGSDGTVLLSRRFPTVERRWKRALTEARHTSCSTAVGALVPLDAIDVAIPGDPAVAAAYIDALAAATAPLPDAPYDVWAPHLLCLRLPQLLWPMVHARRGSVRVLLLPLVAPADLREHLARTDTAHPHAQPSPVAMLPSLAAASVFAEGFAAALAAASGPLTPSSPECDSAREMVASSLPFGTILDTDPLTCLAVRSKPFPAGEAAVAGRDRLPAWMPHLHAAARAKLHFALVETVSAVLHRAGPPLAVQLTATLTCRAELEGLPDVTAPLVCPPGGGVTSLSVHPSVEAPDAPPLPPACASASASTTTLCFSPPLGTFEVARFVPVPPHNKTPPLPLTASYRVAACADDPNTFSFDVQLQLAEKLDGVLDHCEVTFLTRLGVPTAVRATATSGTVAAAASASDKSAAASSCGGVVWRLATGFGRRGRADATVSGRATFAKNRSAAVAEASGGEGGAARSRDDLFCDQHPRAGYARVAFRITGGTLSGVGVDTSQVVVYLAGRGAVRTQVEASSEVVAGDFVLWSRDGPARGDWGE